MAIIAKNKQSESVSPIEAGSYPARIYQIIHIGTVAGYQGQFQNKVRIGFELPTEMHVFDEKKGPQPRVISQDYTLSFSEKANLRKLIVACDPKAFELDDNGLVEEFDVESLMGKSLLVTIGNKPKKDGTGIYAFLEGVTRLPKGMVCEKAINDPIKLSYDNWDNEVFEKLPDFIKEKIKGSDEYKAMTGEINPADVPF